MANQPRGQRRQTAGQESAPILPIQPEKCACCPEPEVRRWPHPVNERREVSQGQDAALHFIHCSLSYQNQLLAEIKTLLETLCLDGETRQGGK